MGVTAKESPRVCIVREKKSPSSLGYPLLVFNKNSALSPLFRLSLSLEISFLVTGLRLQLASSRKRACACTTHAFHYYTIKCAVGGKFCAGYVSCEDRSGMCNTRKIFD